MIFTAMSDGRFDLGGRTVRCALGKGGVKPAADKREGDGASPLGTWVMRRILYRPDRGPPPLTAVLRTRLNIKSDLVLALAVNIVNLIPGSIVLEIDQVRRLIYVHQLDVGSDRSVKQLYHQVHQVERLLIAAFERDSEWHPAGTERA